MKKYKCDCNRELNAGTVVMYVAVGVCVIAYIAVKIGV